MNEREKIRDAFIEKSGWKGCVISTVAGDASFRSYHRLHHGDKTAILMDAPPEYEDTLPFIAIALHLDRLGFRAPAITHHDIEGGFLILEDFGDQLFKHAIAQAPDNEQNMYQGAIDLLVRLQSHPVPNNLPVFEHQPSHELPVYDHALLMRELFLFPNWYLGTGENKTTCPHQQDLSDLFSPLLQKLGKPETLVLRDFHAENLMCLDDGTLGLLDFQDAVHGHPAYDLVSLLQDARRDVSPDLEARMIDYYLDKTGHDRDAFVTHYNILGAQRNTKIIGIFSRLAKRDNKPNYLDMIPHVWGLLDRNLQHPALNDAREWFNKNRQPKA